MISHKHRVIFIHIPKCGGTSVETIFLDDLKISFLERASLVMFPNSNPKIGPKRLSHLTANEMIDNHFISKKLFDEYFKFSVVRDPYNRAFSCYNHLRYNYLMTFNNFLKKVIQPSLENKNGLYWFMKPQKEFIFCNSDSRLLVDKFFKLEEFNYQIKDYYDKFNLMDKSIRLKKLNKSAKKNANIFFKTFEILKAIYMHYKIINAWGGVKVNEKENREIVRKLYEEDYKLFEY